MFSGIWWFYKRVWISVHYSVRDTGILWRTLALEVADFAGVEDSDRSTVCTWLLQCETCVETGEMVETVLCRDYCRKEMTSMCCDQDRVFVRVTPKCLWLVTTCSTVPPRVTGGVGCDEEGIRADEEGIRADEEVIRADEEGILAHVEGIRAHVEGIRADVEGIRADVEGIRADTQGCTYGPPYLTPQDLHCFF
ncbi:hypothetical protein Bbelb_343000 [Branchiostoma belcheri]|nr:hypothetical protein Bbelb_343000 [Branchiostoma belcheri]